MARNDPQVNLRLPAELKEALAQSATGNRRTLTADIVNRLMASFDPNGSSQPLPPPAPLPLYVQQAVKDDMAIYGGTVDESLTRLVRAGQAEGGLQINLRVGPGTSMAKLHQILETALKLIPSDAKTVVNLDATKPD